MIYQVYKYGKSDGQAPKDMPRLHWSVVGMYRSTYHARIAALDVFVVESVAQIAVVALCSLPVERSVVARGELS